MPAEPIPNDKPSGFLFSSCHPFVSTAGLSDVMKGNSVLFLMMDI